MDHSTLVVTVEVAIALIGVILTVAWFLYRNAQAKIDTHGDRLATLESAPSEIKSLRDQLADLDKEIAVSKAARVGERVEKLESDMNEIKGDLREARGDLRRVREWVDQQTAPVSQHRHRRATDPKDEE